MISQEQLEEDKELIKKTRRQWRPLKDLYENETAEMILENSSYFSEKLQNKTLFNLCSEEDFFADFYLGLRDWEDDIKYSALQKGALKVVLVDPFPKMLESSKKMKWGEEYAFNKRKSLVKLDALSFLNNQADCSGNVLTSHIDHLVIPSEEYAQRVVEEIYRVLPSGGIYIASFSPLFEPIANKIFSQSRDFNSRTKVFEK